MFDHVTIRVADVAASERCYTTVLTALGVGPPARYGRYLGFGGDCFLTAAESPAAVTRRLHVGFVAPSRSHVDAFWRAGTEAGLASDGEPGPRPQYVEDYYGAFLLDPDGNSIEAVHHGALREGGIVDHVWLRVADVARARAFYAAVGAHAGFRIGRTDAAERVSFGGSSGTFSIVAGGEPTSGVHLAFGAADDATVAGFHAELVGAGYRDNGGPGPRPEYHRGYYGAFVIDPDGNNVELVHHHHH